MFPLKKCIVKKNIIDSFEHQDNIKITKLSIHEPKKYYDNNFFSPNYEMYKINYFFTFFLYISSFT